MSAATPPIPAQPPGRLRWALTDSWTLTRRDLLHRARQPFNVVVELLFPVLMILMFAYLLGGGFDVPGGNYREFLLPGMMAMGMAFGIEATFTAVANDTSKGVMDRFRSMPMARSAVVSGRAICDMLSAALGLAVVTAAGWLIGWRADEGVAKAALAVGLLLLLRFALVWVGIYLALLLRSPEAVVTLQILVWPLGFLSNAFVSPATMPGWLGAVAAWNPLSATGSAARELFGNPTWAADSWATEHAILLAVAWPTLLVAVFFPLSVRRFKALSR